MITIKDGNDAVEYYYGKTGKAAKTRHALIVPNQTTATYVTQWKYDSYDRLLEMIHPDEEKVAYGYNLGGQVDHVRSYESHGYGYVNKIDCHKFRQRTYLKCCNGAETFYPHDLQRCRLQNLVVNIKVGCSENGYTPVEAALRHKLIHNLRRMEDISILAEEGYQHTGGLYPVTEKTVYKRVVNHRYGQIQQEI